MKNLAFFLLAFCFSNFLFAQNAAPAPPPRVVDFTANPKGNGYQFTASPPPLVQIAGAPKAYWSYYWEFGDGSFSFEESPQHVYESAGVYNPMLYATAHYDDGELPGGMAKGLVADRSGSLPGGLTSVFDSTQIPIRMRAIRQARKNEELVCILSYRNLGTVRTDGHLYLFFNEKKFPSAHFAFDSARVHFNEKVDASVSQALPTDAPPTDGWTLLDLPLNTGGEASFAWNEQVDFEVTPPYGDVTSKSESFPPATILQNLLNTARGAYREERVWRFTDLQPGEKRNLFVGLRGTDKMLKDTNGFIHVLGIFAPFDPLIPPDQFELEFEIVSAHDPNAIAVSDKRINYRTLGNKKIDYKIRFQNNGKGPASTVVLKVEIPEGLDMKKMKAVEWAPKCPICPRDTLARDTLPTGSCLDTMSTSDGLQFTFHNIYLPGTRQEDVNDRDSCKGFVKYRIVADRNMPKYSFRSRAKIIFDKEAPIYTNYTRTRFKVGISPGLKVGWNFVPDSVRSDYFFIGASISPYKSWRVYPQLELLTGIKGQTAGPEIITTSLPDTLPFNSATDEHKVVLTTTTFEKTTNGFISLEVPLQLRKNFNRFFGAGLGGSCRVIFENGRHISQMQQRLDSIQLFPPPPTLLPTTIILLPPVETPLHATHIRYTAFADLTFGSVRKGLNLGLRIGAILERKKKVKPFAQVSLELKL